jgi:predicted permease
MAISFQDIRFAFRSFKNRPGVTIIVLLSLAIGIGVNSAVFSIVDGIFLRPFDVKSPQDLSWVYSNPADGRGRSISYAEYQDLRDQNDVFIGLAAESRRGSLLDIGGETEMVALTVVSDDYFSVLGIDTILGRTFNPDLDKQFQTEPVVIISYGLWQRRFGADPAIIGRSIRLHLDNYTVIGVLPPSFRGLNRMVANDVWVPVPTWVAMSQGSNREITDRASRVFTALGRLRPGANKEQVQAQLDTIAARLEQAYPATNKATRYRAVSTEEEISRGWRLSALLLTAVGLVLLISCANISALLLGQSEVRRREIGMRLALGAGRARLVRQLLTEASLLSISGAAIGLLFARWLIRAAPALLPPGPSFISFDIRIDHRVFFFTLALCVLSPLFFGLVPAFHASRTTVLSALREVDVRGAGGMRWLTPRNVLVVVQVALSVVLLSASGLLFRSFMYTRGLSPGFDANKNMLVFLTTIGASKRPLDLSLAYSQLSERIESVPGIRQVTFARRLALAGSGGGATRQVAIPGVEFPDGRSTIAIKYNQVAPDYFSSVGTRILRGRGFLPSDTRESVKVVLINEAMAERFWSGSEPLDQQIRVGVQDWQIVGIVENGVVNNIHEVAEPYVYFPFSQLPSGEVTLLVETAGDPAAMAAQVKHEMRAEIPEILLLTTLTLREHMRSALYWDWMPAVLAGGLSLLGVVLAAVGLNGVVSYSVGRRTREIGIRMALGAQRTGVIRMVLAETLRLVAVAVPLGLGGAFAAGRYMGSMIYGVRPTDALTFAGSSLAVILVALLSSQIPVLRALRIDPARVLRDQ